MNHEGRPAGGLCVQDMGERGYECQAERKNGEEVRLAAVDLGKSQRVQSDLHLSYRRVMPEDERTGQWRMAQ